MWRAETFQNLLTALINNPDWIVLFIEVCGVIYFFHLIHLMRLKVARAASTVKLIIFLFIFSAIVYACWNYLYIDMGNGLVNPFTGAVQEVHYA